MAISEKSFDTIDKLRKGRIAPKSIAGQARNSIFEFPAFISSSVDYKYAEATCNLLELTYASYLQMAISQAPIISKADMGNPFAQWKTDTNNYLECSNLKDSFDACHNVITEDGVTYEFNLTSIPDRTAEMINEAVDYEPLSEFDHYFMEATAKPKKLPKKPNYTANDMESSHSETTDWVYDPNNPGVVQTDGRGDAIKSKVTNSTTPSTYDVARNNAELRKLDLQNTQLEDIVQNMDTVRELEEKEESLKQREQNLKDAEQRFKDAQERFKDKQDRESLENDPEYKQYKKDLAKFEKEEADYKQQKRELLTQLRINDPDISLAALRQAESILKQKEANDYDQDKLNQLTKFRFDTKVKTPELMDESKIQKLNSLKPLTMTVELKVELWDGPKDPITNEPTKGSKTVMPVIAGVKIYSRLIDAEILPEVAEYPLKEMNRISRNIRWKAGELKFFKDILFRIKEKKQTAVDSHDPKRKWYRRLYELAHTTNDSAAVNALTKGDYGIKDRVFAGVRSHLTGKQAPERYLSNRGFIPNATIIVSKDDINNILSETGIDLLDNGKAFSFCRELFLMNFVVIDMDAQTIKVLTPDLHKDFEIHTLASVEKQLSMIDTASATSREIFKALKK